MVFEWDPVKAAANRAKHGLSFDEASSAFGDPLGRIVDDPRHSVGERRHALVGHTKAGKLVVVMFTERGMAIRIFSARRATRREREDYEKGQS